MTLNIKATEFQSKILKLNLEEFRNLTNIRDVIIEDYQKKNCNRSTEISETRLQQCIEFYFNQRKQIDKWENCCLKLLKLKENSPISVIKANSTAEMSKRKRNLRPKDGEDVEMDQITAAKKLRQKELIDEPSDFQKEIIGLSYEEFVKKTNMKDIIIKEHNYVYTNDKNDHSVELSQEKLDNFLKYYYDIRVHVKDWFKCGLKHLKFIECDCKRNTIMKNKKIQCTVVKLIERKTQTKLIDVKDSETQCNMHVDPRSFIFKPPYSPLSVRKRRADLVLHDSNSQMTSDSQESVISSADQRNLIEEFRMSQLNGFTQSSNIANSSVQDPLNQSASSVHAGSSIVDNLKQLPCFESHQRTNKVSGAGLNTDDEFVMVETDTELLTDVATDQETNQYAITNQQNLIEDLQNSTDSNVDECATNAQIGAMQNQMTPHKTTHEENDPVENQSVSTFVDKTIANIKTEEEKSQYSRYSDEVVIIETSPDKAIIIEDDINTESIFAMMGRSISNNQGSQTLIESQVVSQNPSDRSQLKQQVTTQKESALESEQGIHSPMNHLVLEQVIITQADNRSHLDHSPNEHAYEQRTSTQNSSQSTSGDQSLEKRSQGLTTVSNLSEKTKHSDLTPESVSKLTQDMFPSSPSDCSRIDKENLSMQLCTVIEGTEIPIFEAPSIELSAISSNTQTTISTAPTREIMDTGPVNVQHLVDITPTKAFCNNQSAIPKRILKRQMIAIKSSHMVRPPKKTKQSDPLEKTVVPKFQYRSLEFVANQKRSIECLKSQTSKNNANVNTNSKLMEKELIIEDDDDDDTPPTSGRNRREYSIEEDSSCDENSQPLSNKAQSTTRLLNSQNSLFLNSQVIKACDKTYRTCDLSNIPERPPIKLFAEISKSRSNNSSLESETSSDASVLIIGSKDTSLTETSSSSQAANDNSSMHVAPSLENTEDTRRTKDTFAIETGSLPHATNGNSSMQAAPLLENIEDAQRTKEHAKHLKAEKEAREKSSKQIYINPIIFGSRFQHGFLNYIDIKEINYNLNLKRNTNNFPYTLCREFKDVKTSLRWHYNGFHEITLNGRSTRKVLKLKIKEWSAVEGILQAIHEFTFSSKQLGPKEHNLLYEVLYYLFKTVSRFTNVIIEYCEEDDNHVKIIDSLSNLNFETAETRRKDLSKAIDAYTLSSLLVRKIPKRELSKEEQEEINP